MAETSVVAVLYVVKLARAMMLWIALYLTEKVFQDAYVQRVLVEDEPPPSLLPVAPMALAMELVGFVLVFLALVLLMKWYKAPDNTFVVDGALLRKLALDYALALPVLLGLGMLLAHVVQRGRMLRYRDDGLRGIRALCGMLLALYAVVVAVPFFALA